MEKTKHTKHKTLAQKNWVGVGLDKRTELRNFLREEKMKKPGLRYNLACDRLYLEDKCFQWNPQLGKVVGVEETRPVRSDQHRCQYYCIYISSLTSSWSGSPGISRSLHPED